LAVNGNLTVSSGASLVVQTLSAPTADSYVIASYTGTFTGTVSGAPAGYQITVDATAKEIKLVKTAGYDDWASVIGDETQRGREDDPDGDGFSNLQEYLFGSSPVQNTASLTTMEVSGNNLVIRWKQRTSGASYQLKQSQTLGNDWENSSATVLDDGTASGGYQPKIATIAITADKFFFRVEGVEN
jgi:hypothetical protein